MKNISLILIILVVFSLILAPLTLAISEPINGGEESGDNLKCNNGFGNGDQCAPGNSLEHNRAENHKNFNNPSEGNDGYNKARYPGNSNNNNNNDDNDEDNNFEKK